MAKLPVRQTQTDAERHIFGALVGGAAGTALGQVIGVPFMPSGVAGALGGIALARWDIEQDKKDTGVSIGQIEEDPQLSDNERLNIRERIKLFRARQQQRKDALALAGQQANQLADDLGATAEAVEAAAEEGHDIGDAPTALSSRLQRVRSAFGRIKRAAQAAADEEEERAQELYEELEATRKRNKTLGYIALGGTLGALAGYMVNDTEGSVAGSFFGAAAGLITAGIITSEPTAEDDLVVSGLDDEVGFGPGGAIPYRSWAELQGGPGPWSMERLFLASQYKPDRFGWAALPSTQSAYGPAFANTPAAIPGPGGVPQFGTGFGPAYLNMPHDTAPGLVTPPSYAYQQDVSPRAAEAARVFSGHLRRRGIEVKHAFFRWPGPARAHGTTYAPSWGEHAAAQRIAKRVAQRANLHAVLFTGSEPGTYTIHFTDNPTVLMAQAQGRGAQTSQIAGVGFLGEESISSATSYAAEGLDGFGDYILGGLAGATAGAYLAGEKQRTSGGVAGFLSGIALTWLTDPGPLPPVVTERGDIARDALEMIEDGNVGRVLTMGIWGPAAYWAATEAEHPILAVGLAVGGVGMVAGAARSYARTQRLRSRLEAATKRGPQAKLITEEEAAAGRIIDDPEILEKLATPKKQLRRLSL